MLDFNTYLQFIIAALMMNQIYSIKSHLISKNFINFSVLESGNFGY